MASDKNKILSMIGISQDALIFKRVSRLLSFFIFILLTLTNYAQDIHFSQFDSSPLNLNPALCGNFDGDFRLVGNSRDQWRSVTVPYQTFSASFDSRFKDALFAESIASAGLLFNTDKAGDGEFGTTQIKLALSLGKSLTSDESLIVTLGLDAGYTQNKINYNKLYFGRQFDGNQYIEESNHGEIFSNDKLSYFDFTVGGHAYYLVKNKIPINAGISFTHLNRPKKSFSEFALEELDRKLDRKFNFYVNLMYPINDDFSLIPSILFMNQGKFRETEMGGLIRWKMQSVSFKYVYFGGWYRAADAIILKFGLDYKNINLGLSYDINNSKLRVASNGRGAFEISIIYILRRIKKIPPQEIKYCPTFM